MKKVTKARNKLKSKAENRKSGSPSTKLKVIGVTGTRGKTIVVHMLNDLFKSAGLETGYISSIGCSLNGIDEIDNVSANFLEPGEIHKLLKQMLKNGLKYAIVEITSKNMSLNKYTDLVLDSAVLTNVIDDLKPGYKSLEEYAQTKLEIINMLKDKGLLVVNSDDLGLVNWLKEKSESLVKDIYAYWVSMSNLKDLKAGIEGYNFTIDGRNLKLPLLGNYNLFNSLLSINLAGHYIPVDKLTEILPKIKGTKGRMEVIRNQPFTVIIDYSYTPQMLESSLEFLSDVKKPTARLITVFGCAGERDKSRRKMGGIAAKYSNIVVLTAEDPKAEKVADINSEIYSYAEELGGVMLERFGSNEEYKSLSLDNLKSKISFIVENNDVPFISFDANNFSSRLDAIDFAIRIAKPDDIVYITGKGHENSLVFDKIEYEWSDHIAVEEVLKRKK